MSGAPTPPSRRRPARALARAALVLGLAGAAATCAADGLKPLDDGELGAVSGRDGLAFNLAGFSITPVAGQTTTLTYAMPGSTAANPFTLTLSNFTLSRTDDPSPFTDPYTLDIWHRDGGLPDVIRLSFPKNETLNQRWYFNTDLSITASGSTFDFGNLELNNLALQGGWLDVAPPASPSVQGVSFGLATKLSLDSLVLRPRGLSDSTEMLTLSGLKVASVNGGPWTLTDINTQPGLLNADTDANGNAALHLQIGWQQSSDPAVLAAATGAVSIDRIVFTSNGATTDLGSSRISGIQINFMDVRFRPGT